MTQDKGLALITGASSGIGAVYADRMARRGYGIILVARDARRLEEQASKLQRETQVEVEVLPADLTLKSALGAVEQRLSGDSRITMLINNAGIAMSGDLRAADPEGLESMIQLNAVAPTRLARAVLPGFIARRSGTIINVSSVVALAPERFNATYGSTKAYLLNLSLSLQRELADTGVRVQAVLPGATRTAIWEKAGTDLATLPPSIVMNVEEMVDAALVGLDRGENVTIPSLPDAADWDALTAARLKLGPNLSHDHAAARYRTRFGSTPSQPDRVAALRLQN